MLRRNDNALEGARSSELLSGEQEAWNAGTERSPRTIRVARKNALTRCGDATFLIAAPPRWVGSTSRHGFALRTSSLALAGPKTAYAAESCGDVCLS